MGSFIEFCPQNKVAVLSDDDIRDIGAKIYEKSKLVDGFNKFFKNNKINSKSEIPSIKDNPTKRIILKSFIRMDGISTKKRDESKEEIAISEKEEHMVVDTRDFRYFKDLYGWLIHALKICIIRTS